MIYVPLKSGSILIPSGPSTDPERRYLFVICTDACPESKHLLVPLATYRNEYCDSTCILEPYEHPFIRVKSFVLYRSSRVEFVDTLQKGVNDGILVPREPVNKQTFLRIAKGICRSRGTPQKIKSYYGCMQAIR